jgi:hypothetical protein
MLPFFGYHVQRESRVMSNPNLAAWMFLQLTVILCVVRAVGYLARYLGQPRVVGEMIAGVLIGPSVLGQLFWEPPCP